MTYVLNSMKLARHYVHLFEKLRKQVHIPLRQPVLDYAFGCDYDTNDKRPLFKEFRRVVAEAINVYNQGYDFADRDWYTGEDTVKPNKEEWTILEEGGYWVALYMVFPEWLLKIGEDRKQEREKIMQRKYDRITEKVLATG